MIKLILIVFSLFIFTNAFASEKKQYCEIPTNCEDSSYVLALGSDISNKDVIIKKNLLGSEIERRGCCSHHGGVCGCSDSGRAVCCDGALSPTCGC